MSHALPKPHGPVVLCVMDGVGVGLGGEDDAVATARTPNLDAMRATCPYTTLAAHGLSVGLPSDDDLGNSEVGHNAMGAGRVFAQGARLVNDALRGPAWSTEVWRSLVAGRTLHLLGLVSDGNVHSLIAQAARDGVARLRVHTLTDGRDVAGRSALTWIRPLEARLAEHRAAGRDYRVASGGGRMRITMDRYEADWSMVARGWATHVRGEGRSFASATEAIETMYAEDPSVNDQWLAPFVIGSPPCGRIEDGDSVLLFNFRGDRAIEISRAFTEDGLGHARDDLPRPQVTFAGMMQYDGDLGVPKNFLVAPPAIDRTVGQYLVAAGLRTWACSETQKFGHVTYFYNGNRSGLIDPALERYVEIPSDTRPYDERPWMKSAEITDAAVAAIAEGRFDHLRLNYPNGDMVGHTGHLEATRIAVEAVDLQIGRLRAAVRAAGGVLVVTADHGNADEMWIRKGAVVERGPTGLPVPRNAHTTHRVPFLVDDPRGVARLTTGMANPGIASLGATVLTLCGVTPPDDYLPSLVGPA